MMKIYIKRILFLLIAFAMVIIFCSCANNPVEQEPENNGKIIDTASIKPYGSAITVYKNWKIFRYEYITQTDEEVETYEADGGEEEPTVRYAIFDCSENTPKYVVDVDPLRCFFIDQYAYNIVFNDLGYKALYEIYKYDLESATPEIYESCLGIRNHAGNLLDDSDYTIEKVLYWNGEYVYLDAKEQSSRIHTFFSVELETGRYRIIDERAIPYDLPDPDFDFAEEYVKNEADAVDGVIGIENLYGTITHNGYVSNIEIPLYLYKGRVDYNDYWGHDSVSVDVLPSGIFIRYSYGFNDPKLYDEFAVRNSDPIKSMHLHTVNEALSNVKNLNEYISVPFENIEGLTEHSNFWMCTYPDFNGSVYQQYDQSLIQSFKMNDSGITETNYSDISSIDGYFSILPEYRSYNISADDIYGQDNDYEFYVSAYPMQIIIEE